MNLIEKSIVTIDQPLYKDIQMELSTMFKVYKYINAFNGFGLVGVLAESVADSIKKEVQFQIANRTPIPEPEIKNDPIDFFTVVMNNIEKQS